MASQNLTWLQPQLNLVVLGWETTENDIQILKKIQKRRRPKDQCIRNPDRKIDHRF